MGTWKVRCLDSEEKLKGKIADLEADYDELKEKQEGGRSRARALEKLHHPRAYQWVSERGEAGSLFLQGGGCARFEV